MDHSEIETPRGSFLAFRQAHALPPGTPCFNCGTALLGPWCYACGQSGEDYHRNAWHLVAETFESFFHADGRFWRTLVRLLRDPARLTRDYLAGRRAPQIPPLRLFLSVLLIVFLVGDWAGGHGHLLNMDTATAADRANFMKADVDLGLPPDLEKAVTAWLREHVGRALEHPDVLVGAMGLQAHNYAFVMLPISAFLLALIFAFRRGVVLFDHFIFSMHSLSFQGVLVSTALIAHNAAFLSFVPAGLLLWASPVHLFVHMRGTYGTGVLGTLVRMGVLFLLSVVAFGLLLAALLVAGLEMLHG